MPDLEPPTDNGNAYNAVNPGSSGINGDLNVCDKFLWSCGQGAVALAI